MQKEKNKKAIKAYYVDSKESRWGYKYLLRGTKHYGYYPLNRKLSIAKSQLEMEKQIGETLGLKTGAHVLDAGCGEGWVALHLAQIFGYRIHGIDLLNDPSIVESNKKKEKYAALDLEFTEMDYSDLKFPDNTFDGVYTIETLVHSPDYSKTLKEFYRVLKPGGVLVNFEYSMDDNMNTDVEQVWRFIYEKASMHTLDGFRMGKVIGNWEEAGFGTVSVEDITQNIRPFMRMLYRLAILPYGLTKLLGNEKSHLNTYVGVKSYQKKQRPSFHYVIVKAYKPKR